MKGLKKNILVGITGGIAVYKMVEVASRLTKLGHSVHVVMTEGGSQFVTPLTFQNITRNPVETDLFTPPRHYDVKHISLADRADICLIAPATANFIGKLANGIADDLLTTIIMATKAPVLLAPSMNVNMFDNPILQDNLTYLREKGYEVLEPGTGYLACGYEGKGRLPEPAELVEYLLRHLTVKDFTGKRVLISAGPTREPFDPVRFLTNYSSGKMGYALARAAAYRGAEVKLISGPTDLNPPLGVETIYVKKALEMKETVDRLAEEQDIIIMAAAVADFRPANPQKDKIKKNGSKQEQTQIKLLSNPDILAELGRRKRPGQFLVGFAAESRDLAENARAKLQNKNLDMIIANDISNPQLGFASEENQVLIMTASSTNQLPRLNKLKLADIILDNIFHYQ